MAHQIIDDDFLQELGLHNLSPERKIVVRESLSRQLEQRIALRLSQLLSDEALKEFTRIAEDTPDDSQAAGAWLRQYVPTYDRVVEAEAAALQSDILDDVDAALRQE